MDQRLPAHIEVAGLIRAVEAGGGFATVVRRGDRDAGTILLLLSHNGAAPRLYERMPDPAGGRRWTRRAADAGDDPAAVGAYCDRRAHQDPDLWIVELDIAAAERFIGLTAPGD